MGTLKTVVDALFVLLTMVSRAMQLIYVLLCIYYVVIKLGIIGLILGFFFQFPALILAPIIIAVAFHNYVLLIGGCCVLVFMGLGLGFGLLSEKLECIDNLR